MHLVDGDAASDQALANSLSLFVAGVDYRYRVVPVERIGRERCFGLLGSGCFWINGGEHDVLLMRGERRVMSGCL
ncbi:hypothetical protein BKX93_03220 [Chromobacterium vaccinii]|uniref:Uncharacterized protein n=1 Tax=Chromobacterium vaccinii TaxID=1108595 RepID=A0A1D9LCW8_9NEIS|nr:hypothetical protein BKX93_03220 [Chromobacterium vaccinii]